MLCNNYSAIRLGCKKSQQIFCRKNACQCQLNPSLRKLTIVCHSFIKVDTAV